jgi:hypothetical protein
MIDLQSVLGAAQGQGMPRELVAAREGLSRVQRRAASRAVRRGDAADDPAAARLAVAQARLFVRRRPGAALLWSLAAIVVLMAGVAVWTFARGQVVLGLVFAATTPLSLWALWRLRPAAVTVALEAERRNREALERAGRPYVEDDAAAEPIKLPVGAVAAGVVAVWLLQALTYGTLTSLFDDRVLTLGHVVLRGAAFATLMAVVNLTWMRRRTKRQSQRPIA